VGRRDAMKFFEDHYDEVWSIDFEYYAPLGERPAPICMVAIELLSGREIRLWSDQLEDLSAAPFDVGERSLVVSFYGSAEMSCFLVLGWPMPENLLDLYVEFRALWNGLTPPCGFGLLGALSAFGLDGIASEDKHSMRDLAMRGGPFSPKEREELLEYCASDVVALCELLMKMGPGLDLPRALLRGRFMRAAARIEHVGVPIDTEKLQLLREHWDDIKLHLIKSVDADYGVFIGTSFNRERWAAYLAEHDIPWPRLESGTLAMDDRTFKDMATTYPEIKPMYDLRTTLSSMRLESLAVGSDGRNRCMLSAFQSKTGRNQPSNTKFIYGPAVWLRGLMRPDPGMALAYADWAQQEFGIAASLSGDAAMMAAYRSGDPYLEFAKQAGGVPPDATKQSHGRERDLFKAACLAVQYSMGPVSLALKLQVPTARARELLDLHHQTYRRFWEFSDAAVDFALLHGRLWTTFGWPLRCGAGVNVRSLRNFPMQANGAEMLRFACCLATERGIRVCAPIHDALLIEAPLERIDEAVAETQAAMAEASRIVLDGFELTTDVKIVRYPNRYMDGRGRRMWDEIWQLIEDLCGTE